MILRGGRSFMNTTCIIHYDECPIYVVLIMTCVMTLSCVRHDSCIWFDQVIEAVSSNECMCDMTHSYVWHDLFICVTWIIHMCDRIHSDPWRELSYTCDTTHPYEPLSICHMDAPYLLLCHVDVPLSTAIRNSYKLALIIHVPLPTCHMYIIAHILYI